MFQRDKDVVEIKFRFGHSNVCLIGVYTIRIFKLTWSEVHSHMEASSSLWFSQSFTLSHTAERGTQLFCSSKHANSFSSHADKMLMFSARRIYMIDKLKWYFKWMDASRQDVKCSFKYMKIRHEHKKKRKTSKTVGKYL